MGAEHFSNFVYGKNARAAFKEAVEEARYDYGHVGYTGTIAEKYDFEVIKYRVNGELPTESEAACQAEVLFGRRDPRVSDKWGPAGCIECKSDQPDLRAFFFFGLASS